MSEKLWLSVETVEDNGLLVWNKVYPEKKFVFTGPRGFYEWLCQQMGTNAKPDSHTYDGRVVTSGHELERLERIEKAAFKLLADYGCTQFTLGIEEALKR